MVMKLMELYFGLKILIPTIMITGIIILIIASMIHGKIYNEKKIKIKKLMQDKNYEYYLIDVSSCGGKSTWGFRKNNQIVNCDKIYKMKLRDIKKLY